MTTSAIAQSLSINESIILSIMSTYNGLTVQMLQDLILGTDVKGCQFINIKNYSSDVTNNTEVADQLVNIGISYVNMLAKDSVSLDSYDIDTIKNVLLPNVQAHNFDKYDLSKFANPSNPSAEIVDLLPMALIALKQPTKVQRTDNNIKLNKVLSYNTNTHNLLIFGQSVNKTVTVKGESKKVASAPMTVAKNIITSTLKKSDLRTFKISNIGSIKISGGTLEIA